MFYISSNHTCTKKQRDTFSLKVCYQSDIVSNPLCKIFLTSLSNLHNVQNLELKINWGFMKGSDMKIQRCHWVMKKHHLSTLTALGKPPPGHSTDAHCTHPSLTHQPLWERDSDELIKQIISKMCFDDGNMISVATKNEPTDTNTIIHWKPVMNDLVVDESQLCWHWVSPW